GAVGHAEPRVRRGPRRRPGSQRRGAFGLQLRGSGQQRRLPYVAGGGPAPPRGRRPPSPTAARPPGPPPPAAPPPAAASPPFPSPSLALTASAPGPAGGRGGARRAAGPRPWTAGLRSGTPAWKRCSTPCAAPAPPAAGAPAASLRSARLSGTRNFAAAAASTA